MGWILSVINPVDAEVTHLVLKQYRWPRFVVILDSLNGVKLQRTGVYSGWDEDRSILALYRCDRRLRLLHKCPFHHNGVLATDPSSPTIKFWSDVFP